MSYHFLVQGKKDKVVLRLSPNGDKPEPIADLVHGTLKGWVLSPGFPCMGARAAFNMYSYRLGIYESFRGANTAALAGDLETYISEYNATPAVPAKAAEGNQVPLSRTFATFLACFKEEPVCDESVFEERLWTMLENLRVSDKIPRPSQYSSNPQDNKFAFCYGGEAFFVAAFHPGSWRWSRRFMLPLIVFNMHKQFEGLKSTGKFLPFRDQIRANDYKLQGSSNSIVADFGEKPEASQYAMRKVPDKWVPPGWKG